MRLHVLLKLSIVACVLSEILAKIEPNDNNELKIDLQQEITRKNGVNKIHRHNITFDDLFEDVLFLIFRELNFFSLLHVVKINAKCASIANAVFRLKYRDFEVRLWKADFNGDEKVRIETRSKAIGIDDYELAVRVLKNFGNSIQRVRIDYSRMSSNCSAELNRLLVASESIKNFHINFIREETFSQFTAPFQAVEDFGFYIYTGNFTGHILPLNQLLPQLRSLRLMLFSDVDYSFIDHNFPFLEKFEFNMGNIPIVKRLDLIENVLKKNPEIKNIEARFCPAKLVKNINNLLPNLSNLLLHDFRHSLNETIHFGNVTFFKSDSMYMESIDKLTFSSRLTTVEMVYNNEKYNVWRDFFRKHQTVQKLLMKFIDLTDNEQLVDIVAEVRELRELILESYGPFSGDVIKRIIENNEKLIRFEFSLSRYYSIESVGDICEQFEDEWTIQKLEAKNGFCFERKEGLKSTI